VQITVAETLGIEGRRGAYFDTAGTPFGSSSQVVLPNQAANFDQRYDSNLFAGYKGGGIVASDQPIVAIVNEVSSQGPEAIGNKNRIETYNASRGTEAATSVSLPQLVKNISDQVTLNDLITIQNNSDSAATGNITFNPLDGSGPYVKAISIPAWSSIFVDLTSESILPSSFIGSAQISTDRAVSAIVTRMGSDSAGSFQAYPGFTSGSTTVNIPVLLRYVTDSDQGLTYSTGIQLRSLGGSANVSLQIYDSAGVLQETLNCTANPTCAFDQRSDGVLPVGFFGNAVITSNVNIAAIINVVADFDAVKGFVATTFRGFRSSDGGTMLLAPHVLKNIADGAVTYGSGMQVRSLGGNTDVAITYFNSLTGNSFSRTQACNPSCGFDQRSDPAITDAAFAGTAVLTSSQPIIARVSVVGAGTSALGDLAENYAAFPY